MLDISLFFWVLTYLLLTCSREGIAIVDMGSASACNDHYYLVIVVVVFRLKIECNLRVYFLRLQIGSMGTQPQTGVEQ